MAELLDPRTKNIKPLYKTELEGMISTPLKYELLQNVIPSLVKTIHETITEKDRKFLLEFKKGQPDWQNFPVPGVAQLPAIQWKLFNLARMPLMKRKQAIAKLQKILWG